MATVRPDVATIEEIRTEKIRVLVERHPQLMEPLAEYGFDLCCGGEHPIAEAARLHGLDAEEIFTKVFDTLDMSIPTA
ncbi:MAG TPA: DUF542 domain-containing protein [Thermomicrobiales bacterium]|nr:DUF542 domain-containing protein [Thermomicrobiales bacterium]HRA31946.1 DUF542 domain-containing protein [Thermomicrobiales bacterium]